MKEIWKDIKNYNGFYKISNLGNVINKHDRILKNQKEKTGYIRITLWDNGERKHFLVHRLVAENFIENPNNFPQIHHKDGNKNNNSVENLEWCTQSHTMKEAYRLGLRGKNNERNKKSIKRS